MKNDRSKQLSEYRNKARIAIEVNRLDKVEKHYFFRFRQMQTIEKELSRRNLLSGKCTGTEENEFFKVFFSFLQLSLSMNYSNDQ